MMLKSNNSLFESGLSLRGHYISYTQCIFDNNYDLCNFCLGLFWPGYPTCYATNYKFLKCLQDALKNAGVDSEIHPFSNCECQYRLSCNKQQYDIFTQQYSINYQI